MASKGSSWTTGAWNSSSVAHSSFLASTALTVSPSPIDTCQFWPPTSLQSFHVVGGLWLSLCTALHSHSLLVDIRVPACCRRSWCFSPPTNPGVPHDLSAGRCLGTVWYHCDITMATLGLNAGTGHAVSRSRPSVLSPEAVLQGRLRVVALAVIGDASLTPSRVRVVLFCLQP